MTRVGVLALALIMAASSTAAAAWKVGFAADGPSEAAIRAAWDKWITTGDWTDSRGPERAVAAVCLADQPTCAAAVAGLGADQIWIVGVSKTGALVGRVYDAGGALILSDQLDCPGCAKKNAAAITATATSLLVKLRAGLQLQTHLVIDVAGDGLAVTIDGRPVTAAAGGTTVDEVVAPGPHTIAVTGTCREPATQPVTAVLGKTVHASVAPVAQLPVLRVRTTAGATVAIDGRAVGVAGADGLESKQAAGRHRVTVSRPGWRSTGADVTLTGCEAREVALALDRKTRGPLPYALGIGGVAVLAGGVALVIADRDMIVDGQRQPTYRDSSPLGWTMVGVGAVAAGAGVYLWYRGRPTETAPIVSVGPGGAAVGVAGRF